MKRNPAVEAFYRGLDLDVRIVGISGKVNIFASGRLRALIRQEQVDIVHTHLSSATVWGCLAAIGENLPCVAHVHSLNKRAPYSFASKVIAVSEAAKAHLVRQGHKEAGIEVVWPANADPPGDAEPAADLVSLGPLVITCAAHLRESKGVLVLLRAAKKVIEEIPSTIIAFAGEGPERWKAEKMAKQFGIEHNVRFLGFRTDIHAVFAASRVAVLPSLAPEGFGLVLAEANALGIPAVASNVGGVSEIIEDGKNGILVPAGDVDALASAILQLLKDEELWLRFSKMAKEKSREFSFEKSALDCMNVFQNLTKSK